MTKFIGKQLVFSQQREFLNNELIPEFSKKFTKGNKILIIGVGVNWDYREDFPQCEVITTDLYEKADFKDDICNSKLDTEYYDGVIFNGMWETVADPLMAMRQINRITKKDGLLLFGAPFRMDTWDKDYWRLTPKGAEKALNENGFKIIEAHNLENIYLYYIAKKHD